MIQQITIKPTASIDAARDSAASASINSSLLYICSSLCEIASPFTPPFASLPFSVLSSDSLYQKITTTLLVVNLQFVILIRMYFMHSLQH